MSSFYEKLLANNRDWVAESLKTDPEFFGKLTKKSPPLFWIGCADARVPANEIIGAQPGEVFVHRNIANMVVHTDMNMLSVLDYAVNTLKVEHIIICGHYGCGGVKAAMSDQRLGLIDNWIKHIRDVARFHKLELSELKVETERYDRFVELNVHEQVRNLGNTSIIQAAWKNNQKVSIYGWAYTVENGLVKDLDITLSSNDDLQNVFSLD